MQAQNNKSSVMPDKDTVMLDVEIVINETNMCVRDGGLLDYNDLHGD
jgi:hypothetical protein